MCTLATVALLLTGCGQDNVMIDEGAGIATASVNITEPDSSTRPKRQESRNPAESSAENTDIQTTAQADNDSESTAVSDTGTVQTSAEPDTKTEKAGSDSVQTDSSPAPANTDTAVQTTSSAVSIETPTEVYYLDGIVYDVKEKYIVINETDFKKMKISVSDKSMIADINAGDTVEITYNGLINENSEKFAYDVYSIEVTKKADKKYSLQHYESNGVGFSMLVPEGWQNKEIDYPHDNDFTDWGIRFSPDGASESMDITWHSSITINGSFDKETVVINDVSARKYSRQGVWRFFVFENNYVATNNFFETSHHNDYADDMEIMLNTLEFI